MQQTFYTFLCLMLCVIHGKTQNPSYPDLVYKPTIRSVHLFKGGEPLKQPIIQLGSTETIRVLFDDLEPGTRSYAYKIIHCDQDWQPSDLVFMQYMNGFESMDIFGYEVSQNATTAYTSYMVSFPNEYMQPILSGNYLIKVFTSGNEDDVLFTRRFMISENTMSVPAMVRAPGVVQYRNQGQEIFFNLNIGNFNIQDKFTDLKVVILQNNRWDNAITNLKPRFMSGNTMDYNYNTGETVFEAGNQWRFLDLKTFQVAMPPARKIIFSEDKYRIFVDQDQSRRDVGYLSNADLNGKLVYYSQDFLDRNIDQDYAFVYFALNNVSEFVGYDMYIIGEFSFGALLPEYKMAYNHQTGAYEVSSLMKQGYYNYMYVLAKQGTTVGSTDWIEGNSQMTENDYTVLVYVREPGDISMRLVGNTTINSLVNR